MRTKTLYTEHYWKLLTGVLPIESGMTLYTHQGLAYNLDPGRESYLRANREKFAPYIKASKRTSRHGLLLDIIKSDASHDTVRAAIDYYRGFRSGFRTIVQMIENENKRLLKTYSFDPPGLGSYWSSDPDSHIIELVELLGWMQTDQAHAYLVHLATGDVHPYVHAVAIDAMAFEGKKFDWQFILKLVQDPKTPEPLIYNALFGMLYNGYRYQGKGFCSAIWPYVTHSSWNLRSGAINALAVRNDGRQRLRKHLENLKADPDLNMTTIKHIESNLFSYDEAMKLGLT